MEMGGGRGSAYKTPTATRMNFPRPSLTTVLAATGAGVFAATGAGVLVAAQESAQQREAAERQQLVAIAAAAAARQPKTGSAPQQHGAQAPGETSSAPQQEKDLVALATLIVDTASLAVAAYALKKSRGEPSAEMIATDVSRRLMEQGRDAPDHITEVVREVIRAIADQERARTAETRAARQRLDEQAAAHAAEVKRIRTNAAHERDELRARAERAERAERDLDAAHERAELAQARQETGTAETRPGDGGGEAANPRSKEPGT